MTDHPAAFVIGERVYLRPIEDTDLPLLYVWFNDPELRRLTGEVAPASYSAVREYVERIRKDESRAWFAIVVKDNDQVIGECGLLRMFHAWRTTDLTIIIGDKMAWGKGYGSEAIVLLMDYAFGYLNFHRVAIGVVGSNVRALRFYEKMGFKREGIQRDGYYYDHSYQDFVMMSILDYEFRESHRRQAGQEHKDGLKGR